MAAPDNAYPIGQPARESGDQKEIDQLEFIPNFECPACGHAGKGEDLLGVNGADTMWCPVCGSTGWIWV